MARINLWDGEDLGYEGNKLMSDAIDRWDRAPNIVRALARNRDVFVGEDFWAERLMKKGLLSRKFKESIATTVSATNKCLYCTSAHAYAMELTGTAKEKVDAVTELRFDLFENKELVALEFARKATLDSKSITDQDMNKLKEYFSEAEIVEIAAVIMAFKGYNTFVEILGLEIDDWMDRGLQDRW